MLWIVKINPDSDLAKRLDLPPGATTGWSGLAVVAAICGGVALLFAIVRGLVNKRGITGLTVLLAIVALSFPAGIVLGRGRAAAPRDRSDPYSHPAGVHAVPALAQLVADHHALDLARALPDPVDAKLAVEPLHRLLPHVAAPAVDLHGAVDDASGRLAAQQLHGSSERVQFLAIGAAARGLPAHPVQQ
jgi:hypothetical protein